MELKDIIPDREPKTLLEAAVRLEHESQYWTAYDPVLIKGTVGLAKTAEEKISRLELAKNKEGKEFILSLIKGGFYTILTGAIILFLVWLIGGQITTYNNIKGEILRRGVSKEVLEESGWSSTIINGTRVYFEKITRE